MKTHPLSTYQEQLLRRMARGEHIYERRKAGKWMDGNRAMIGEGGDTISSQTIRAFLIRGLIQEADGNKMVRSYSIAEKGRALLNAIQTTEAMRAARVPATNLQPLLSWPSERTATATRPAPTIGGSTRVRSSVERNTQKNPGT